ncbi:hypothetical protein PFISCL1PPCAC_2449, partial [Pristionchus fissidentatus]
VLPFSLLSCRIEFASSLSSSILSIASTHTHSTNSLAGIGRQPTMNRTSLLTTHLHKALSITDTAYDGVIVVSHSAAALAACPQLQQLSPAVEKYLELNRTANHSACVIPVDKSLLPSGRLIYAGTGIVSRDYDDVRRFGHAARDALKLALGAGVKHPLLVTVPHKNFPQAELVSALGALQPAYIPLHVKDDEPEKQTLASFGVLPVGDSTSRLLEILEAMDEAFTVTRDIGETGPERMAPPKVAAYLEKAFAGSKSVKLIITDDQAVIEKEYPLMAAVNRSANTVERHRARHIRLEYQGEGEVQATYYLVGKGVTLDTGGCDLKVGGSMWGMCRDKYGAAVVAGFFKALEKLQPKNIKVVGQLGVVRNSIGSNAYSCDEIITSRSGKRIHIYNTDAEGRLVMLDPLTKACEEAQTAVNPHLMTVATLTGHEVLTYGYYASFMDNGPAKRDGLSAAIQKAGDEFGQPIEITRLHHEDFAFHLPDSGAAAHLRQGNTKPSVQTVRGHMGPAAFLIQGSRLDEHGLDSSSPIPFTHVDMGSCEGEHPHTSYPNPLVALVAGLVI